MGGAGKRALAKAAAAEGAEAKGEGGEAACVKLGWWDGCVRGGLNRGELGFIGPVWDGRRPLGAQMPPPRLIEGEGAPPSVEM